MSGTISRLQTVAETDHWCRATVVLLIPPVSLSSLSSRLRLDQLQKLRADDKYDLLWNYIQRMVTELDLNEIKLPRYIRRPARYEQNSHTAHHFDSSKDYYRVQYFTFLDCVINHISYRFEQRGMIM